MSNDLVFDFDFEGVAPMDAPPMTVIRDFGQFRLAARKQVTMFVKGASITIPEITDNGQSFTRKGIQEGGKTTAVFFVREGEKQNGEVFVETRIFTSMSNIPVDAATVAKYPVCTLDERQKELFEKGETVWICDWSNLQIPAIQALGKDTAKMIGSGKPFYASADNWNVGRKPNVVNEGTEDEKKYYDRYWYNFTLYPDKAAMVAAREAHFAGLNGNGASAFSYPVTPAWGNNVQAMADYIKGEYAKDKTKLAELAKQSGLYEGNLATNDKPVDYKGILADILEIPAALVPDVK